jgi:hypothetical protein
MLRKGVVIGGKKMKKRLATVVLVLAISTSGVVFGEGGWTPGKPKPAGSSVSDSWFTQVTAFCTDFWNYWIF